MVDRRRFVTTLGASTVLPALSAAWGKPASADYGGLAGERSRVSLHGEWERYVDGDLYDVMTVPSSQRPSGFYKLRRSFLLPQLLRQERAFLHFEGITYFGRAYVNGAELGTMSLYVPYEFEFTRHAQPGSNTVEVAIRDLTSGPTGEGGDELTLGVNDGWEAYGGIVRDVYVEVRPAAFIDNLQFGYELSSDYAQAACRVRVFLSSDATTSGQVEVALHQGKTQVARAEKQVQLPAGASEAELEFEVNGPALWSPEQPNLYELRARLHSSHGEDAWSCRTGFRKVVARGRDFEMNGKRLVLKGVCRHDMWKNQGFTLTRQQMEQDMRSIRELGCNFVRLVHYPHHRYVVELADHLGLFVSEEPGYWGMDFKTMPPLMIELGYRILERVIRRDWNSPAVFAWLLSNECNLTVESLKKGKELCHSLDPIKRFVSAANSMSKDKAKPVFEQAGMDFFDQHPYTYNLDEFNEEAEFDGPGKPLTFTEWGGKAIGQTQLVMQNTVDRLLDLVETHRLAGHVFWSWQDMRQYSRMDGEMRNGVLESGVVTEAREAREVVYLELARLFAGRRHEGETPRTRPEVLPLRRLTWSRKGVDVFQPLDLQPLVDGQDGARAWAFLEASMAKFWAGTPMAQDQWKVTGGKFFLWCGSRVEIAGVAFHTPVVNDHVRPIILTPETPEVTIPVGLACARLHVLGQVTFPTGFPVTGRPGETVASYSLRHASGKVQEVLLRNGYEVVQSNLVHVATRINPVATEAQQALLFIKDRAREHYQVLLYSIPVQGGKVTSIKCRLNGEQPSLAIFAITAERA